MRNQSGYSLIEVLTVIGIVAILAALAIPNLIGWKRDVWFSPTPVSTLKYCVSLTSIEALLPLSVMIDGCASTLALSCVSRKRRIPKKSSGLW